MASYDKEEYLANAKAIKEMLDTNQDFILDMCYFARNPQMESVAFFSREELMDMKHTCGTSYCLAGYQAVLANYPEGYFNENGEFSHEYFSKSISGTHSTWTAEWTFIYGGDWPNTRESAYKRINYIIENNGVIPAQDTWDDFR